MRFVEFTNTAPTTPAKGGTPTEVKPTAQLGIPPSRRGPEVRDIQQVLVKLGYSVGETGADGIRGPYTTAAVKKFQQDNNLQVDGDPGPETVGALNNIIKQKNITFTKSTDTDVKPYAWQAGVITGPNDIGKTDTIPLTGADVDKARKVCDEYVGRKLSDEDWQWLTKTLAGESASNAKSYAWCTAVILNRSLNPSKFRASGSSIKDVVLAPFQFEAVTGRGGHGLHPNQGFLSGPNKNQLNMICSGIISELPSISHKYAGFTATNPAAYGDRARGERIIAQKRQNPGATEIAGTIFTYA